MEGKYEEIWKILANILSLTIIICGIVGNYSASKVNAEIKDEYYKESIMTGDLSINGKKIKNENQNQNISKLSDGIVYQYENSDERELEFSENSEGEKFNLQEIFILKIIMTWGRQIQTFQGILWQKKILR